MKKHCIELAVSFTFFNHSSAIINEVILGISDHDHDDSNSEAQWMKYNDFIKIEIVYF